MKRRDLYTFLWPASMDVARKRAAVTGRRQKVKAGRVKVQGLGPVQVWLVQEVGA